MNCYLDTSNKSDVSCTRIRIKGSTALLIDVSGKNKKEEPEREISDDKQYVIRQKSVDSETGESRRPNEFYSDDEEKEHPAPEILYSVGDESCLEQGSGGFVNVVKARHESIAEEQSIAVRRDSVQEPANTDFTFKRRASTGEPKFSSTGSTKSSERNPPPIDEYIPEEQENTTPGGSEVVYSLTDVTDFEQGEGGFVKSLRARHESIAKEESEEGREAFRSLRSSGRRPRVQKENEVVAV